MAIGYTKASVARIATVSAVVAMTLSAGVTATINKNNPDANANNGYIRTWSASGSQVGGMHTNGNLSISGSFIANGTTITAPESQASLDSRYVNTSGDTMTGNLIVHGTISGSVLSGNILEVNQINYQDVPFQFSLSGTALAVGSGTAIYRIPPSLNGFNIISAFYGVDNPGVTNVTKFQIYNRTQATTVFSTPYSIDSTESTTATAATPGVVNAANDNVATNDVLQFGIPAVSTTAPQGLNGYIRFALP